MNPSENPKRMLSPEEIEGLISQLQNERFGMYSDMSVKVGEQNAARYFDEKKKKEWEERGIVCARDGYSENDIDEIATHLRLSPQDFGNLPIWQASLLKSKFDMDGQVTSDTAAEYGMTRFEAEELVGDTMDMPIEPEDFERIMEKAYKEGTGSLGKESEKSFGERR